MKRFMKILGIAGIAFCLCGFAMIGIGYAFGGEDYMKAENLADIKNVFFRTVESDLKRGLKEIGNIKIDTGEVKVDIGDIKVGNKQKDSTDSDDVQTWKLDDVRLGSVSSIKADLDCIDFDIAVSEDRDFHLSYELQCMNRTNPLSYSLENGILTLKETNFKGASQGKSFWDMGSTTDKYYSFITLHVPSDIVLKSCIFPFTFKPAAEISPSAISSCKSPEIDVSEKTISPSSVLITVFAQELSFMLISPSVVSISIVLQ